MSDYVRRKALRVASMADEARDRADTMVERLRLSTLLHGDASGETPEYARRRAILAWRAADLAELYADLSGATGEGV